MWTWIYLDPSYNMLFHQCFVPKVQYTNPDRDAVLKCCCFTLQAITSWSCCCRKGIPSCVLVISALGTWSTCQVCGLTAFALLTSDMMSTATSASSRVSLSGTADQQHNHQQQQQQLTFSLFFLFTIPQLTIAACLLFTCSQLYVVSNFLLLCRTSSPVTPNNRAINWFIPDFSNYGKGSS